MALTPASWLVDKSVLARVDVPAVADAVLPRVQAGQVGVALVTELEVGYSARSGADYDATRQELLDLLIPVTDAHSGRGASPRAPARPRRSAVSTAA